MKIRGFEKIKEIGIIPSRATKNSAGYDFYAPEELIIKANEKGPVYTYIKAYMQEDEFLAIYIRSSMAIKKGLELVNQVGIVDSDYYGNSTNDGNIIIWLYNKSDKDITINKGDKIAQGIFTKFLKVDDDSCVEKRNGGFGSSDK